MTEGHQRATLAERVAARAGVDESAVTTVMATYGVSAAAAPAAPRSLRLVRLRIAGTKADVPGAGPFDRTFTFPTGVVMAVAPNLKGKSSLLEIITLCLRGSGRDLQADVAAWLDTVECDIELNGVALAIRLTLDDGDIVRGVVYSAASVTELADGVAAGRPLFDVSGSSRYADAIEALMLDRLDLEPIHAVDQRAGLQQHGWRSYFSALYPPSGGERPLIGETAMAGLAGRLLAVFLDLPRTAVLTRIRTALTNLRAEAENARKASVSPRATELRAVHQRALDEAQIALAALPVTPGPSTTDAAERVAALGAHLAAAERDWQELARAHRKAKADRQDDERALNSLRENVVAARLFHGLDPASCPRCETPVAPERKVRETAEHVCAVCTAPLVGEDDAEAQGELIREREEALVAAQQAEEEARRALEEAEAETARLTSELQDAEVELTDARTAREVGERVRLEAAVARAEGALAALTEAEEPPPEGEPDPTAAVLEALVAELDTEMRAGSEDLLRELGDEIATLANEFGIAAVTGARVNLAAALRIEKGGAAPSAFSGQSTGERLRLRIATIVALLRVGARRGIATHPGLLMLDSLRAEEVQESDAHAVLQALTTIAGETPGLQIITTTADETLPDGRLPEDHVLRPPVAGGPLW